MGIIFSGMESKHRASIFSCKSEWVNPTGKRFVMPWSFVFLYGKALQGAFSIRAEEYTSCFCEMVRVIGDFMPDFRIRRCCRFGAGCDVLESTIDNDLSRKFYFESFQFLSLLFRQFTDHISFFRTQVNTIVTTCTMTGCQFAGNQRLAESWFIQVDLSYQIR